MNKHSKKRFEGQKGSYFKTKGEFVDRIRSGYKSSFEAESAFSAFGFQSDPFSPNLPLKFPELAYFDREHTRIFFEEVGKRLRKRDDLIVISRPVNDPELFAQTLRPLHLLVVGAAKSGRTTLLQITDQMFDGLPHPEDTNVNIRSLFVDTIDWAVKKTGNLQTDFESFNRQFQQWVSKHEDQFEQLDLLFVDNIAVAYRFWPIVLRTLHDDFKSFPIVIGTLTYSQLEWLETTNQSNSREDVQLESEPLSQYSSLQSPQSTFLNQFGHHHFILHPFHSMVEMVNFLKKRLTAGRHTSGSFGNIISESVLKHIAFYSCGIPGLALELGSQVFSFAYKRGKQTIDHIAVDMVARRHQYDIAAQILSSLGQLRPSSPYFQRMSSFAKEQDFFEESGNLAPLILKQPKLTILNQLLVTAGEALAVTGNVSEHISEVKVGITNSSLSEILGMNVASIRYHMKDLEGRGAVKVFATGRERIYFIDGAVLSALEMFLAAQHDP